MSNIIKVSNIEEQKINIFNDAPPPIIELQEKTVIPSEVMQFVYPDPKYAGLSKVIVEAIPFATTEEVESIFSLEV